MKNTVVLGTAKHAYIVLIGNAPRYSPYMNIYSDKHELIGSFEEKKLKQLQKQLHKRLGAYPANSRKNRKPQ